MCDIYYHKCAVIGCERAIEFHIPDWNMEREEFLVYCPDHAYLTDVRFTKFRVKKASGKVTEILENGYLFLPEVFCNNDDKVSRINTEMKEGDIWSVYCFWVRPSYRTGYHPNATEAEMEEIKVSMPIMPKWGIYHPRPGQKGDIMTAGVVRINADKL